MYCARLGDWERISSFWKCGHRISKRSSCTMLCILPRLAGAKSTIQTTMDAKTPWSWRAIFRRTLKIELPPPPSQQVSGHPPDDSFQLPAAIFQAQDRFASVGLAWGCWDKYQRGGIAFDLFLADPHLSGSG